MILKPVFLPESITDKSRAHDLLKALQLFFNDIDGTINGGLSFEENFDASIVEHTFTTVDTEEEISHDLGKIPEYYLLANLSANAVIYNSGTSFTNTNIYLKSSATCIVKLIIF